MSNRRYPDNTVSILSHYERDLQGILHSNAYARYFDKTQVVYLVPFDHITRRGLHVQLVSHFSRTLGKRLGLNLDLIEAIALGHDVGHPPFGHEGEGYLSTLSLEYGVGAFSHSAQTCRLFEVIEPLNLSFEVLDGFLCHDGGMKSRVSAPRSNKDWKEFDEECAERLKNPAQDFIPATAEALLVKICDTVSYLGRDIEDGLALGLIDQQHIPWGPFGGSNQSFLETVRLDVLHCYKEEGKLGFSTKIFEALKAIREFNFEHIYWHPKLKTESKKIERAFRLMFESLLNEWSERGEESLLWTAFLHSRTEKYRSNGTPARWVVDFIAGMTDRYFLKLLNERIIPQKIEINT